MKVMKEVSKLDLPRKLKEWICKYDQVYGDRSSFLWKWVYKLTTDRDPGFVFSCVQAGNAENLGIQKTKFTIFVAMVDDIADNHKDILRRNSR